MKRRNDDVESNPHIFVDRDDRSFVFFGCFKR